MITFKEIRNIYNETPLNTMINDYSKRQQDNIKQNEIQFESFLVELNKQLNSRLIIPFFKSLQNEILKNIVRESYREDLIQFYDILIETSKPKTTDYKILNSLEWQIEQTLQHSYNELSFEKKFQIIFQIIFGIFNSKVQKQFLKLLKKYNYNPSLDLLEIMTFVIDYHNGKIDLDTLEKRLNFLTTINKIYKTRKKSLIIETSYGKIPFTYANEQLGINDTSSLTLGKCHFLTSKYLKEFPNLYGAYYYIPNYFQGFTEHSVLIDYNKNYVYDLSHNIALPLEYFNLYYKNNLSFSISSSYFNKLRYFIKHEYGYPLYINHIEEVKRKLTIF